VDAPHAHHRIDNLFCISCHEEILSNFPYPLPASPKSAVGFGGGARD
jgi:hypothetical protein